MANIKGGEKLEAKLNEIAAGVSGKATLRVGFLEGATYPDGTPVAMVAAVQNFGASIDKGPSEVTVYRKVNAAGTGFLRGGRFVKQSKANFASTYHVAAHVIVIPPRPFFSNMVAAKSEDWPDALAANLKAVRYNARTAMRRMGEGIAGQLRQSIIDTNEPPLAKSTVRRKGFDKPLIDTSHMINSVDYEVE